MGHSEKSIALEKKSLRIASNSHRLKTEDISKNIETEPGSIAVSPDGDHPKTITPQGKKTSTQSNDLLIFERILSEISSKFANLSPQSIDDHIEAGLKRIGEFLNGDRTNLMILDPDLTFGQGQPKIYFWIKEKALTSKYKSAYAAFPWSTSQLLKGKNIQFSSPDQLPPEAEIDKKTIRDIGVESCINVPISLEGPIVCALSIVTFNRQFTWPEEIIPRLRILGEVFANALVRKKKDLESKRAFEKNQNQLKFEKILSKISNDLSNLPSMDFDTQLLDALEQVGLFLNADRCTVRIKDNIFSKNQKGPILYTWSEKGVKPLPKYTDAYKTFPWGSSQLLDGKTYLLNHIDELPEEAAIDKNALLQVGIKSAVGVPISAGGSFIGDLSIVSVRKSRHWPEEIIPRLRLVGEIFANAIARRIKEMEFQNAFNQNNELLKFERILSNISSDFANFNTENFDKHIGHALEQIGLFLDADRGNVRLKDNDMISSRNRPIHYHWTREGVTPLPKYKNTYEIFPWCANQLLNEKALLFLKLDELPEEAAFDKESMRRVGIKSCVSVPITIAGSIIGDLAMVSVNEHRNWSKEIIPRLRLVGEIFANTIVRNEKERKMAKAFDEIKALKSQIEADCSYLQEEIELAYDHYNMIGRSDAFKSVIFKIQQIVDMDTTVLISGETGTGKELVARAIHGNSKRKHRPMIKVNCAALSSHLIESELFGHEKGSFTGAHERRIGRFEHADGNTIFLDEIGELPLESQTKLLRVLQEGELERLGSSHTIKVDVRVIAATNRNLDDEVKQGRFRQDLWYRLNIFPIDMPPLRQRTEDIPLLVEWFVNKYNKKLGRSVQKIPLTVLKNLQNYEWPGNIRELENTIERGIIFSRGATLQLPAPLSVAKNLPQKSHKQYTLDEMQREYILKTLEETKWRVSGPAGAAKILGLPPSTLKSRMIKLKIK